MRKIHATVAATLALAALAITAPGASAVGVDLGPAGISAGAVTVGGVTFTGVCKDEYYGAGVGSPSFTIQVQGEGTAVGTGGTTVLDTQVKCHVYQGTAHRIFTGMFTPGSAAFVTGSYNTTSSSAVKVCWEVLAFTGVTVSSGINC